MTGAFVTATGTELGKTFVMAALVREARAAGRPVLALKPVASGITPGEEAASDPGQILAAQGVPLTDAALAAVTPWRFPAPLSPDMAARAAGQALPFERIRAWVADRLSNAPSGTLALVEGAGGIMSPIADDALNIDLARALDLPAILVAGSYLGTISHTLTACETLRTRNIRLCGVIVSETRESTVDFADTLAALSARVPGPVLGLRRGGSVPPLLAALGLGA